MPLRLVGVGGRVPAVWGQEVAECQGQHGQGGQLQAKGAAQVGCPSWFGNFLLTQGWPPDVASGWGVSHFPRARSRVWTTLGAP